MTMTSPSTHGLDLKEDGDGFALLVTNANGTISQVHLTAEQLLILAQSAPLFAERALAKFRPSTAGVEPVFVTQVKEIFLNVDSLAQGVLMMPIAHSGSRLMFELTPDLAQDLIERLPAWIEKARAKQTKQ
jgi:hypothetical protein